MITKARNNQRRNVLLNAYRDAVRDTAVKTMAKRMTPSMSAREKVFNTAKKQRKNKTPNSMRAWQKATARFIGR